MGDCSSASLRIDRRQSLHSKHAKTLCPRGYQEDTIMGNLMEITTTQFHLKPTEIRPYESIKGSWWAS